MKRALFFGLLFLSFVSFASAQYYYGGFGIAEQAIDSLVQNIEPVLRALLGGSDWTGYLLFEKLLLFILISIITGLVLEKVPVFKREGGGVSKGVFRLIAIIIGLLGVRNLNYLWINTILVQYQVLFIAIAGILPFIIYWAFMNNIGDSGAIRKIGWSLYAAIYFGLWSTNEQPAYASVYLWGGIFALIYAYFIDGSLKTYLDNQKIKANRVRQTWLLMSSNDEEIRKLERQLQSTAQGPAYKALNDQIDTLRARSVELAKQANA